MGSSAGPAVSTPPPGSITSTRIRTRATRAWCQYGDLTDSTNQIRIILQGRPDEIYTLGAYSYVAVLFEAPETPITA